MFLVCNEVDGYWNIKYFSWMIKQTIENMGIQI